MGHRLSKIYTRTGDHGDTGLADGTRLAKDSPRLGLIGDLDELNSVLGLLLAQDIPAPIRGHIVNIQHDLFDAGGEVSMPGHALLKGAAVTRLEQVLDDLNAALPPLKEFILPGGGLSSGLCQLARAVCRRAERTAVSLHKREALNDALLQYLNRLSDLLFVVARCLAKAQGSEETLWRKPARSP